MRVLRLFFTLAAFLFTAASSDMPEPISSPPAKQPFTIDDYFKIKRIKELALSSDGERVAYAVEWQSLEKNKTLRHVYVSATAPGAEAELIDDIQDARSLAWIPDRHELAFLSGRGGTTQVFSYDISSRTIRERTESEDPVVKFRYAPDGQSFAYITQDANDETPSLYDQFQNSDTGILIDPDTTSVYDFVNPDRPKFFLRPYRNLWIKIEKNLPIQTTIPGNVSEFYWSSDAKMLSVTYVAGDVPITIGSDRRTSIGIYEIEHGNFRRLASAKIPVHGQAGTSFVGGEWIPGKKKILVRRITETDLWVSRSYPDWALVDLSNAIELEQDKQIWNEIEIYGLDTEPAFIPVDETQIYSNRTIRAVRSLYRVTESGALEIADIVRDFRGSTSSFQFSADFKKAVFVNESLKHPQEIYVWRKGQSASQLTRFNEVVVKRLLPNAREVNWNSADGTAVHGWLLEPVQTKQSRKPWPLVTFVHGGPGYAMAQEFADYFDLWPYPFKVYALNGMAVFLPNYRGTKTYGREFTDPRSIDDEPVKDVLSGIEYLIRQGIADPERLAISGHSHGGWLGPLIMTRAHKFRAGSFAESWGNMVVNYDLMSATTTRRVHDQVIGQTLYQDPGRYVELSPALNLMGQGTAVLFEAGSSSLAISMLGYPKAALYASMPTEFVVYPKTGHNISSPRLQKESARRNLDWFRFWLRDEKGSDPADVGQYERWRRMPEKRPLVEDRPEMEAIRSEELVHE